MNALSQIASRVILSWGWERRAIAFLGGAFGVLALPPLGFIPAFFVPMTLAVWLLDGCGGKSSGGSAFSSGSLRQAADVGWWLGFGYFLAGLWWVGEALLVDAKDFAWALPLAVIGLPAGLALFTAFGFVAARLLWTPGFRRLLALAAGLGLAEYARGHVLTGFPWDAFGMALGGTAVLGQTASLWGLYGLTVVAVILFAAPSLLADFSSAKPGAPPWIGLGLATMGWAALLGFGAIRLDSPNLKAVPGVHLRLMQPDLQQDEKFRPENGEKILAKYLALSDRATSPAAPGLSKVTHLVWPESAFPFILSRTPAALDVIRRALPAKTILITGAARYEDPRTPSGQGRYFNSIQVLGPLGIGDTYDKVHLVPFGEYLPFDSILERLGLQDLVRLPGGFTAGDRSKLLESPGLPPILPLICYEAIFPIEHAIRDRPGLTPGLILNVTNDGWFGRTVGPYQHFAQARLRAIEEGLPLVRAANTGVSAVVDPYGRVLGELPLGVANVLDSALPQSLPPTVFAKWPVLSEVLVWLAALLGALVGRTRS